MAADEAQGRVRIWLVLALCLAAALFEGFDIQTLGAVCRGSPSRCT